MDGIGSAQGRVHSASAMVRHSGTCRRKSRATAMHEPKNAPAAWLRGRYRCGVAQVQSTTTSAASKAAFSSGVISLMVSFTRLRLSISSTLTITSSPSLRYSRTSFTRSGTI